MTHLSIVIYAIRNKINGKFYIGSTNNIGCRKSAHLSVLRKQKHHSAILQRAYNKYGEKSFLFEIIEVTTEELRVEREQHYLDVLKPEYNSCLFADRPPSLLGREFTPEHKAHLSAALMGRVSPMKGKHFTKEHRRKISEANKGNSHRGYGWHHTQETKEKLRLHHNKKSNPPKSKEAKRRISIFFKAWHASLTLEEKEKRAKTTREAHLLPPRKTSCEICKKKIIYQPDGTNIPKTCGPVCLSEWRRRATATRKRIAGRLQ